MKEKFIYTFEKRSKLLLRLNYLVIIATILYAILDKFLGIYVQFYVYLAFLVFGLFNILLIRYKQIEISKVISLLVFNIMVFLVTNSEPFSTGMYLHFVSAGTVAMAVYGYEQWKGAIAFILLSLGLDLIAFTLGFSVIPWRDVDPEQARVFFLLNTVIAVAVCVYTFMMYSKINFDSEKVLRKNKMLIKEQNDQLLKTNSELDRFVYSASHDLRAPLSTLTGLINLLELEKDEKAKGEYLELMKGRIQSMDSFISEIINYSRNTRIEVKSENISVRELLCEIIEDLKYVDNGQKIKFNWEFEDEITIQSDRTRLKMVFSNLISNAIKYKDRWKDEVWIKLKGKADPNVVKICIEDNGIGIKEEYHGRIFDMFFRANENANGSGLGLYITRETLKKLSGDIKVESAIGEGSKFTVTLPLRNTV